MLVYCAFLKHYLLLRWGVGKQSAGSLVSELALFCSADMTLAINIEFRCMLSWGII